MKTLHFAICLLMSNVAACLSADIPQVNLERFKVVKSDTIVAIRDPAGDQIVTIQFTRFGTNDATYKWTLEDRHISKKMTGEGRVFELFQRSLQSDGTVKLTEKGSRTKIEVGASEFHWSYGGVDHGWFYYDSNKSKVFRIEGPKVSPVNPPAQTNNPAKSSPNSLCN